MSFQHLTPAQLHHMLDDASLLLVDIRNDHELVSGVLPGAIHIPLGYIADAFEHLPKDKSLVFYCRSGVRSVSASEFALAHGYENVAHLSGGILAWVGAGLPVVNP